MPESREDIFPEGELPNNHSEDVDLRVFDEGKFITPSPAEGSDIKILKSDVAAEIPVSFATRENRFRMAGSQENTNQGVIISGFFGDHKARVFHIFVTEGLRRTGISKKLLQALEHKLRQLGIKQLYASFANDTTIDFFLKNGYSIVSLDSLAEGTKKTLVISPQDFDSFIVSLEAYRAAGESVAQHKKVLLLHEL